MPEIGDNVTIYPGAKIFGKIKIGDRVKVNATIVSIYNKAGSIIGYAQMQYVRPGQCYSMPSWEVLLDNGECIELNERYLNPDRE